ncbi:hypothetical protein NIES2104_31030 [Leptolyngbya sp. NIES-2104]|nr:hypothetical protein NIES2104_31030 [Leptolyngbya sp. NIES-2104]
METRKIGAIRNLRQSENCEFFVIVDRTNLLYTFPTVFVGTVEL